MLQPDITPLRQELRSRLFQGELGKLAVPVKYVSTGNDGNEGIAIPEERQGLIISGKETQLSDAMLAFADTKLDMALGNGSLRENMVRANRALTALTSLAGASKSSQITVLTDALVRDVLSQHGIATGQRR